MDAPALIQHNGQTNEQELRARYDAIVKSALPDYCLVTLSLKYFSEYLHVVGQAQFRSIVAALFKQICPLLSVGECIAHIHFGYFNLIMHCKFDLDALHSLASKLHFAVRDNMERAFGRKLYLSIGFYPIQPPYATFFDARYFADLSRKGPQYRFEETNYDMYGLSYIDRKENFRRLESSVQQALERGDFKLYLQPKVNLVTGEIVSAEALVRWHDAERGMIPLSDFLPQMEENGSIRDLDIYLFDVACGYMDRWLNTYGKKITISFNLDQAYFNDSLFMPEYTDLFKRYHIPPDCVCIELLESIVLDDMEHLVPLVQDIYDFGFSCALDDFGSGFSSFSVLTSVHLSELKIDRSLFRDINNPKERALIKHIVDVSHDLGMFCVAEGIETKAYADFLKDIGCDFIQGFYYYRPMPADEFEARFITNTFSPS